MHINAEGLRLVEEEEAFIPFVYDDFVEPRHAADFEREWKGGPVKGTLTIGYGTTMPKNRVRLGNRIDRATAEAWLAADMREAEAAVERLVEVPLNENQFAALVSFVYNVGDGALQTSTLRRLLNAGNYDALPRELNKYVNSKGKRMAGLVRRRAREGALWSKPIAGENERPTETNPDVPIATITPDAVPDKTPSNSRTMWGAGGGLSAVLMSTLGYVTDVKVLLAIGAVVIVAAFLLIGKERIQRFFDERVLGQREPG